MPTSVMRCHHADRSHPVLSCRQDSSCAIMQARVMLCHHADKRHAVPSCKQESCCAVMQTNVMRCHHANKRHPVLCWHAPIWQKGCSASPASSSCTNAVLTLKSKCVGGTNSKGARRSYSECGSAIQARSAAAVAASEPMCSTSLAMLCMSLHPREHRPKITYL